MLASGIPSLSINVPQGQHLISGSQASIINPAPEYAWGRGQHDSMANTTLMRGREGSLPSKLKRKTLSSTDRHADS